MTNVKQVLVLFLLLHSLSRAQWERVPDVPENRLVYALLAVNDTIYAGTDSCVYVGVHTGTQWFAGVPPVTNPDAVSCILKHKNVLLVGTLVGGIFKSTDEGLSWQPFSAGLSGLGAWDISALQIRRDSLIAGTLGAGVFTTSADFTTPWSALGDSISEYQGDNVFEMLAVGNTVLAGAGANGYMFRYTDARPWWDPVPINTPRLVGQIVLGLTSDSSTVVAGTNSGIYRSTDAGLSWERTGLSIPPLTMAIHLVSHESSFFAVTTTPLSSSIFVSSDQGQSWKSLGEFPMPNVLDIAISGETLYLGRGEGLWRAPLAALLPTATETSATPNAFGLDQNYPNPFNPATAIRFRLLAVSDVKLEVFDLLGREVALLANERKSPGSYEVNFDATDLPSGVYVYRLRAGSVVETKKMLLVK